MSVALVWLRRDLRLRDQPALAAALETAETVVPVFCFDDRLLHGRHSSGPRTQFLLEALTDLGHNLRAIGGGLVVRHGDPAEELTALALEMRASTVHACVDVGPFARVRDRAVSEALAEHNIPLRGHPGLFAVDDVAALRTTAGQPYCVFTPFYRTWLAQGRRELSETPSAMPPLPARLDRGRIPTLEDLGLRQGVADPAPGGESAGVAALARFLDGPVVHYRDGQNELGEERCSRVSPYLHFGCLSARDIEEQLPGGVGAEAFRRQLAWRDFFAHVIRGFPGNARHEHQSRYRGSIRWAEDEERLRAWCEGRTGYPLVDAGMRQLLAEGWMHNRARLVVGSFLTKDLGIDWRLGERHFMSLLLDGDEASNNGGWQWIASVGVDAQPAFKRIFNPARQQERFDPDGSYVRRHVPELQPVPDRYLAEPWHMPHQLQREIGCVIGRDYPEPIVDHVEARREALARYKAVNSRLIDISNAR